MAKTVYLHVGLPKTGTTYLQNRLYANRARLSRGGVSYPVGLRLDMFHAALDLLDRPWGGMRDEARGEWDTLARRARRAPGSVVISHEILAGATRAQVDRALSSFGSAEVHVVVTARDIARQVPAEWQEKVKHQRTMRFAKFRSRIQDPDRDSGTARLFWQAQDLPAVVQRWGFGLDPSRVHIVTVPKSGAAPGQLWRRFCQAVDIDPALAPTDAPRGNPSLGVAQTAMLRELNLRLRRTDLSDGDYRTLVRRVLVHQTLAHETKGRRLALPPQDHEWASDVADAWIKSLRRSKVTVHGRLADLRPVPVSEDAWRDPDQPASRRVADAALTALVAMTQEAARRDDPDQHLSARVLKAADRIRNL
jgi:hypothetical protein